MNSYGIAAFRSRQQVLYYEKVLIRHGIASRVVSTPREVAAGCGLSLQFSVENASAVQSILTKDRPSNLIGIYLVDHSDGRTKLVALSK